MRIGFGIKSTSQREIGLPELFALKPALNWRQPIPFGPLLFNQLLRLKHNREIPDPDGNVNPAPFPQESWGMVKSGASIP